MGDVGTADEHPDERKIQGCHSSHTYLRAGDTTNSVELQTHPQFPKSTSALLGRLSARTCSTARPVKVNQMLKMKSNTNPYAFR